MEISIAEEDQLLLHMTFKSAAVEGMEGTEVGDIDLRAVVTMRTVTSNSFHFIEFLSI